LKRACWRVCSSGISPMLPPMTCHNPVDQRRLDNETDCPTGAIRLDQSKVDATDRPCPHIWAFRQRLQHETATSEMRVEIPVLSVARTVVLRLVPALVCNTGSFAVSLWKFLRA
jgi:hypothetical protein